MIQDPGLGGTIANGLGDIAKFMVNLENIRAQNQAEQQRIALAKQQQDFLQQQAAAKLVEEQRLANSMAPGFEALAQGDRQAMDLEVAPVGGLGGLPLGAQIKTPAVDSVLRAFQAVAPQDRMAFAAAAKERLQAIDKSRELTTVAEGAKLYDPRTGQATFTNDKPVNRGTEYESAKQTAGFGQIPDADLTNEQNARIRQEILARAMAGRSVTTFNMGNSIAAEGVKAAIPRVGAAADAAGSAARDLTALLEMKTLMDKGIKTGFAANERLALGSFLVSMGWADNTVANTQAYKSIVGQRVAEVIKQFRPATDKDRIYAEGVAGGTIANTDAAIRRVIAIGERVARETIENGNRQAELLPPEIRAPFLTRDPTAPPAPNINMNVARTGPGFAVWQGDNKTYAVKVRDGRPYIRVYADGQFHELQVPQ